MAKINKKLAFVVIFYLFTTNAIAKGSYQYDLNIERSSLSDNSTHTTTTNLFLDYHIAPVMYGDYPYTEASFIDRHSSISLVASSRFRDFSSDNISTRRYVGRIKYSENNFPITVSGYFLSQKSDGSINDFLIDSKGNLKGVSAGLYLTSHTFGEINYNVYVNDELINGDPNYHYENTFIEARLRHLQVLSNEKYIVVSFLASKNEFLAKDEIFQTTEKYNIYEASINLKYYFNKSFGIGFGFYQDKVRNADRDGGKEFIVSLSKYYTPKTSLDFEIAQYISDNENNDNDYDWLAFSLTHRF